MTRRKQFLDASRLQALSINLLLPPGIRLVEESEVGKRHQEPWEEPSSMQPYIQEVKPEVIIDGVRATSRQLALKEKEAQKMF